MALFGCLIKQAAFAA